MAEGNISVQIWKTVIIVSIAQICYKLTKEKLNCKLFDIYIYIYIYIHNMHIIYIIYIIHIIYYIYIYIYNLQVNLYIQFTISSCYSSILLTLGLIGGDGGLGTLCHTCGFACHQWVLKTFPGFGYLRSEDGVVWLWHLLVNFHIHVYTYNWIYIYTYIYI